MTKRIGMLTSGGDCPGLNAAIRGVAKASYQLFGDVEIVGILDGYGGLIDGRYREMDKEEFSGILTIGGTILRTSRRKGETVRQNSGKYMDVFKAMAKNYDKMGLDCLVTIGGDGTHKAAGILQEHGLNIIGLPKTIDNDIWGTDVTFGYQSAVNIATDVLDRVHTTAVSHSRVLIVELMGNTAGWLTLSAGIAGGADVRRPCERGWRRGCCRRLAALRTHAGHTRAARRCIDWLRWRAITRHGCRTRLGDDYLPGHWYPGVVRARLCPR